MMIRSASALQSSVPVCQVLVGPIRGFASEKQLKGRMKSVKGIQKITKAVYMVASAKLRRAQLRLEAARSFSKPMEDVWKTPEPKDKDKKQQRYLLVPITSDRGLCGGFNSSVVREAKKVITDLLKTYQSATVIAYGEKAKVGMERAFGEHFTATITDYSKLPQRTFKQTAMLADVINKANFDLGHILVNSFKNLLTFETMTVPVVPKKVWEESQYDAFVNYEIQGNVDTIENLIEFRNAVALWHWFVECDTSELTARMNAMQGAASNTKELLGALQLQYNKTRQSRITTELCEVIGGAIAAEEFGGSDEESSSGGGDEEHAESSTQPQPAVVS